MRLNVNGKPTELPDRITVRELLEHMGLGGQPAAVEVNRELVPKREHATRTVNEGDRVEVVTLVGGG